ncbi:hypothetical protein Y032_0309g2077 [Ancylostoma ceylanicum]|uniref:Uncharacterized protein n=3 Tax=Ancylostoma ceylanicum TaxID=53326 RepID=A0A016S2U0_9BILA|nr:hypothetical protein Y032_0309g2077 [Ancylostoma ceylanicum]
MLPFTAGPKMSPMSAARFAKDDVDHETKWWQEYPRTNYVERARAQNMYDNYITDVWVKPKQLARSASFTNLTYVKETIHDYPIRKSDSVSTLAPSLALPQYCREAQRIVHTVPVYKPHVHNWYNKSYSVARFKDTHDIINRPYRPAINYVSPMSSHVPYYSFQTRRIFFDEKLRNSQPYLRESQKYLDRYVGARLKADDFANRFAYSAYEWRKPQDHAFNRHFMYDQGVTAFTPTGNPVSFYDKQALRRLYKMTGRFYF